MNAFSDSVASYLGTRISLYKRKDTIAEKMCNQDANDNISNSKVWRPEDQAEPTPSRPGSSQLYRPDILETIEAKIKEMDTELRELSLDIHGIINRSYCDHFSDP